MNPYRIEPETRVSVDEPPTHDDDAVVVWVWFATGAILILAEAGQPGPWGTWSSLGMLISVLALIALWRHYHAKWRS